MTPSSATKGGGSGYLCRTSRRAAVRQHRVSWGKKPDAHQAGRGQSGREGKAGKWRGQGGMGEETRRAPGREGGQGGWTRQAGREAEGAVCNVRLPRARVLKREDEIDDVLETKPARHLSGGRIDSARPAVPTDTHVGRGCREAGESKATAGMPIPPAPPHPPTYSPRWGAGAGTLAKSWQQPPHSVALRTVFFLSIENKSFTYGLKRLRLQCLEPLAQVLDVPGQSRTVRTGIDQQHPSIDQRQQPSRLRFATAWHTSRRRTAHVLRAHVAKCIRVARRSEAKRAQPRTHPRWLSNVCVADLFFLDVLWHC